MDLILHISSAVQAQLDAVETEMAGFCQANEELASRLVAVTHLHDESRDWARNSATLAKVNGNRCATLEKEVEAVVELVQPTGSSLHEQTLDLPARIKAVTM